ncbi:hypothetical protein HYDPIDRAFT_30070 [Hydnomerulius pinastri MD-312]|uniref:Uncharacterized protein n=1 Tax=Hydnomerulius pinastri MD-312 TaxID=994086 RepID=A0A0C9VXF8_9AGAM|nr:hypothetical protein HYDPIDRAFT_30070 [Hydnomerulius pinastri MD-312]
MRVSTVFFVLLSVASGISAAAIPELKRDSIQQRGSGYPPQGPPDNIEERSLPNYSPGGPPDYIAGRGLSGTLSDVFSRVTKGLQAAKA